MEKPPMEMPESNLELRDLKQERLEIIAQMLDLVESLKESSEVISFPGILPEVYASIKESDEEYPGYSTPIDEILERCEKEGIKVVSAKNPLSGNIFVVPKGSEDVEMDAIGLQYLVIDNIQNEDLRKLVELKNKFLELVKEMKKKK